MAEETIIQTLTRLETTAETIKSLMERVSDLESQFGDYSEKAAETLSELNWADGLPDRLGKIEDTASPLKEKSGELNDKLMEMAQKEQETLESLKTSIKEMEKYFGIEN